MFYQLVILSKYDERVEADDSPLWRMRDVTAEVVLKLVRTSGIKSHK